MPHALFFLTLAGVLVFCSLSYDSLWARVGLWWCAGSFFWIALGYTGLGPRVFMKKKDGRLHPLSYLLLLPSHLLNYAIWAVLKATNRENAYHEIVPGLLLGRKLSHEEAQRLVAEKNPAILDLTCEFAEVIPLRSQSYYLCIPVLDDGIPTEDELAQGVAFIQKYIPERPVYAHCALGHGRSATFVSAYLLAAGVVHDADTAEEELRRVRPGVKLRRGQKRLLGTFKS